MVARDQSTESFHHQPGLSNLVLLHQVLARLLAHHLPLRPKNYHPRHLLP